MQIFAIRNTSWLKNASLEEKVLEVPEIQPRQMSDITKETTHIVVAEERESEKFFPDPISSVVNVVLSRDDSIQAELLTDKKPTRIQIAGQPSSSPKITLAVALFIPPRHCCRCRTRP